MREQRLSSFFAIPSCATFDKNSVEWDLYRFSRTAYYHAAAIADVTNAQAALDDAFNGFDVLLDFQDV